jgi:hypothetical protein
MSLSSTPHIRTTKQSSLVVVTVGQVGVALASSVIPLIFIGLEVFSPSNRIMQA